MYLEAFSAAKNPKRTFANEDRLVIIFDKAYGVIDGVTDKSGKSYDGLSGGQVAGLLIEAAVRQLVERPDYIALTAEELVSRINQLFIDKYQQIGMKQLVQSDRNAGFAAQLALVLTGATSYKFFLIGDCGVRLNGHEVFWPKKVGDDITSHIRAHIYHFLEAKGASDDVELSLSRHYTLEGLKVFFPPGESWINQLELARLKTELLGMLRAQFPEISPELIEDIVMQGIRGQAKYRNLDSPLGSACLDGSPIPPGLIVSFERPRKEVNMIELFSDGYFGYPEGTTVADWETRFRTIEEEDPAKVKRFLSTKGSDDRTVLILKEHSAHV